MKTKLLFSLFYLLSIGLIEAQTLYTSYNGKNFDQVQAIAIDAQGNKWIGTYYGVVMFDGVNWSEYTTSNSGLASNDVRAIAIDPTGNKWFCTNGGGVSKFDGAIWTTYTTDNSSLPSNDVFSIAIDEKGNKWFGSNAVSKFDGVNWTNYSTQDMANAVGYSFRVAIDGFGNIWSGSNYSDVRKFDGVAWTVVTVDPAIRYDKINAIAFDLQNNPWIATERSGLGYFNGSTWKTYTTADGMSSNNVRCIAIDVNNRKWVGAQGWINTFTDKFEGKFYSMWNTGIPVHAIAIDAQGKKWYGTNSGLCYDSYQNAFPLLAKIQIGLVFNDINGNGQKDPGETNMNSQIIKVDNNFITIQSDSYFYSYLAKGTHTFVYRLQDTWQLTTDSLFSVTISNSNVTDTLRFGVQRMSNIHDVQTKITGSPTRPGFQSTYWLDYANLGTLTENGSVSIVLDELIEVQNSFPAPDSIIGNRLAWKFSNLLPNERRHASIQTKMPDFQHIGDTLVSVAHIVTGFTQSSDNLYQVITGSIDPNDKLVKQGVGSKGYVLHGTELAYTLRFQNTGTDTAFNVNIRDSLDLNMDVPSLRILASSHPVRLDMRGQNEATFRFENIFLPDSNANQLGSNGYVTYAIRPKNNLPENTAIKNKGYIYFDFNPPVVTNQTTNTYVSIIPNIITSNSKPENLNTGLTIFPNPSKESLNLKIDELITNTHFELLDISGQSVLKQAIKTKQIQIDISELKAGTYLYRFTTNDGVKFGKVVKQ